LSAARRVFERLGYIDASVDDIVREAGVARGSFYTYFPDKLALFRILSVDVNADVLDAVAPRVPEGSSLVDRIEASNGRYIAAYRDNAKIYGLIEQMATIDPAVHRDRLRGRREHVRRVKNSIERWQREGLAENDLDTTAVAGALVSMTSNFCYWWFVGEDRYDEADAIKVINAIWIRSIGLGGLAGATDR
jgi:AcrR family transcriptional regulator